MELGISGDNVGCQCRPLPIRGCKDSLSDSPGGFLEEDVSVAL